MIRNDHENQRKKTLEFNRLWLFGGMHFGVDLEMDPFIGTTQTQMKLQVKGTEMAEAERQKAQTVFVE